MQPQISRRFHSKLAARGLRVPGWSLKKGFKPKTVYSALSGRFTGKRRGGLIVARVLNAIAREIAA